MSKIPKVLHYCWLSDDAMPPKLAACVESWKKYCPDFEIINWNFDRLGDNAPVWVRQAFDAKKYAFAADWVRAYALASFGGIYLDSDVEIIKPLDDLLGNDYLLSYEGESDSTIEAAVMGAVAGLPFFKNLLAYYDGREFVKADGSLDMFPLPGIINTVSEGRFSFVRVANPEESIRRTEAQRGTGNNSEMYILPWQYLSPKSVHTGKINLAPETHTIHHFSGTWQTPWDRFYRSLRHFARKIPGVHRLKVKLFGVYGKK